MFVLGYPVPLLEALSALAPLPSTITDAATADFYVDEDTGETVPAKFRAVYNGSAEAQIIPQDSGRFTSTRVDATAAINAGLINLILPRRFDVPPAEGGFVISEPVSFRDAIINQFEGAQNYCNEVRATLPSSDTRLLQIAVNKVGYINSIMKNSIPGRLSSARNDRSPAEVSDIEAAFIVGNVADIIVGVTVARETLLSNAPGDPDAGQQAAAEQILDAVCAIVDETINIIDRGDVCVEDSQCDDGNPCTVNTCNLAGVCETTTKPDGAVCSPDLTCIGGVCGTDEEQRILFLKNEIVRIAEANTDRTDNIDEVRAQLDPLVDELEQYFIADRPENEAQLVQGSWKSLWYDDPDIDQADIFIEIDRNNVYQVVFDTFYYNVTNNTLDLGLVEPTLVHSFLKGNFTLTNLPDDTNVGEPRLNVIDLEFDDNVARLGGIPQDKNLVELVEEVDSGQLLTIPVPGPKGITGELWNAYLDDELRISRGFSDENGVLDLYILRRVQTASD
jgi:hypothetical protein